MNYNIFTSAWEIDDALDFDKLLRRNNILIFLNNSKNKTDGGTVYNQILINEILKPGKRGKKIRAD